MTYFATKREQLKLLPWTKSFAVILLLFFLFGIQFTPIGQRLEQSISLNGLFHLRGPRPPPEDVIIVSLNSAAAERLGYSRHSYTWPRTIYANLLSQLQQTKADLVVMDIAFRSSRDEEEDAALEHALTQSHNVILYKYLKRRQIKTPQGTIDIEEALPPLGRFANHALASGFFVLPKTSGNIQTSNLFHDLPGGAEASQPLLAYLALQSLPKQNSLWQNLTGEPLDTRIPLDARAKRLRKLASSAKWYDIPKQTASLFSIFAEARPLIINYYGGAQTISHIDIDRVLEMSESELRKWFDNKVVYVGYLETWQTEQQDAYSTVFTSQNGVDISGVEISATVFANLSHGDAIRPVGLLIQAALLALCLGLPLLTFRLPLPLNLVSQLMFVSAYLGTALWLFRDGYIWTPLALPFMALILSNVFLLVLRYLENRRRLTKIRHALHSYLPDEAATALSRDLVTLESQHKVVSGVVLVTDIIGYTALSENMPPDQLHTLMNRYYEVLLACVKRNRGVVGNIVGDSLMTLWTSSKVDIHMCQQALSCAQEIHQAIMEDFELSKKLPTCIAIHGGQFSLGNLGAQGHFEYSPVGDIINTSTRIEHFNRELGTHILVSQNVASQLNSLNQLEYKLRYLGVFNLRNKASATPLYTKNLPTTEANRQFRDAVDAFQQHRYADALTQFLALHKEFSDGPCHYYIQACQQQLKSKLKNGEQAS